MPSNLTVDSSIVNTVDSSIVNEVSKFIGAAKDAAKGGLSLAEAYALLTDGIATFMKLVAALQAPGEDKKALVISACLDLYDVISPKIVVPYVPFFLQSYIKSQIRAAIAPTLSLVIDKLYSHLWPVLQPPQSA